MNPDHPNIDSRETHSTNLVVEHSIENDVAIVEETINELQWLKEQGYQSRLPAEIQCLINEGKSPTKEEIAQAVSSEFNSEKYEEISRAIKDSWLERQEGFLHKLATLDLPIQPEYVVRLTQYGVGGGYHQPNLIDANINEVDPRDILTTAFHEMIHLVIEDEIQQNNIDHWTKERLVDLTFGRFFPERKELQHNPEYSERIDGIFNQHFPDLRTVIHETANLIKEES